MHPPHAHSRGGVSWRPILCSGYARVCADDYAVRAACSHTALAPFPNCRNDKNNKNGSLRRNAREGILIVDRCYRRCQDVAQDFGHQYAAGSGWDQSPELDPWRPVFQCNGVVERRNCVGMGHGRRRVSVRDLEEVRQYRRWIVDRSLIIFARVFIPALSIQILRGNRRLMRDASRAGLLRSAGVCWFALASLRAQIAVQFGVCAQREPSPVSGRAASPPLVVVEL